MWNAYADKEVIISIRELADKYATKALRPKDTRMKNEELLATMAYMRFSNMKNGTRYTDMLNIYIKNRRLCARISQKKNVTKLLSDISSEDQSELTKFLEAIKHVQVFLEKVRLLCDDDSETLNTLMGQRKKGVQAKTDQNYYFMWLIIDSVDIDNIRSNKEQWVEKIREFFMRIQDLDETDANSFLNQQLQLLRA